MTLAARIASYLSPASAAARRRRAIHPRLESAAHVLRVRFDRPDGRAWWTIGGGTTLAVALADARSGLPGGHWEVAGFEYVYGD
jgi:hypothetical protein